MLFTGLALALGGCGSAVPEYQRAFNDSMRATYGEDVRIVHSFVRDSGHVLLLLDGARLREMNDADVEERAGEVAELALVHGNVHAGARSLTVRFVRFLPGAGASYCGARSVEYGIDWDAAVEEERLRIRSMEFNRTPCP